MVRSSRPLGFVAGSVLWLAGACIPGARDLGDDPAAPQPINNPPPAGNGTIGQAPPVPMRPPAATTPPGAAPGAPVVNAEVKPPAVSGGTLVVLRDGKTAVAADPDRDAVFTVDLESERLVSTLQLQPGDEPGRLVETEAGQVVVVLRRGGALVSFTPASAAVIKRQAVCPAPRGIAFDAASKRLHVACSGGELVTLAAATLGEEKRVVLDRDLRDVVVSGDQLFVSRFRSAEVLKVKAVDGSLIERLRPPGSLAANRPLSEMSSMPAPANRRSAEPSVAWRMRPLAGGGAVMIHQESGNGELGTEAGGYGGGPCKSPMGSTVVEFRSDGAPVTSGQIMMTSMPVDFDISADRKYFAMISLGGSPFSRTPVSVGLLAPIFQQTDCVQPPPPEGPIEFRPPAGEAVAVAFDGKGRLVAQTREPARLEILTHKGGSVKLSDVSRADTGHQIFHMVTSAGLACAACHPEGGDDGRVWRFTKIGERRTQNLLGGIGGTAPFHWDGDMKDLTHLMGEVFTGRMRGPSLDSKQVEALGSWLDKLPALPRTMPTDATAINRGKVLFHDTKVACATCHKGELMTDNSSRLVGTGRMLQVPSLRGLATRAPFMHNGCAKTIANRFDVTCGGGDAHGVTSHLDKAQLADLVTYLESL